MILYALYVDAIFFPCHPYIWSTTVLHDSSLYTGIMRLEVLSVYRHKKLYKKISLGQGLLVGSPSIVRVTALVMMMLLVVTLHPYLLPFIL